MKNVILSSLVLFSSFVYSQAPKLSLCENFYTGIMSNNRDIEKPVNLTGFYSLYYMTDAKNNLISLVFIDNNDTSKTRVIHFDIISQYSVKGMNPYSVYESKDEYGDGMEIEYKSNGHTHSVTLKYNMFTLVYYTKPIY